MGTVRCTNCGKLDSKNGCVSKQLCNACYLRTLRHSGNPNGGRKANNGRTKHPLYDDYVRMRARVSGSSTDCRKNYVDRGIGIYDRWLGIDGFDNFVADMGDKPSYDKGKGGRILWTLDRIDNDKGYSPENCRWADSVMQANNTRKNKRYTVRGVTGTLSELSRHFGIVPLHNVDVRFYCYGWDLEKALLTPVRGKR